MAAQAPAGSAIDAQHAFPSWHDAARDTSTREQVIRAVYNLFARRKPGMAGQFQQNKLPDFIRRLEESLYKMAASREEYADLNTLEQRLQQVVHHIVRKPGATTSRGGSQGDSLPSLQQGDAQHAALYQAQQQQQQQQQAAGAANGMGWAVDVGLAQQQGAPPGAQQQQQQQPVVVVGGGGNQLAVAGAPAGHSTAESAQRNSVDYNSLAAAGGDVTSAVTLPQQQQQQQQPQQHQQQQRPPSQPGAGGGGQLSSMGGAALNPNFMTNGAPVLLRGGGGASPGLGGMMPTGGGGMMQLGGGGMPGMPGMMPMGQQMGQQQVMMGDGGGLPGLKLEGGGMVPVGGGSAGMLQLPQQQVMMGQGGYGAQLGGGANGGMMIASGPANGFNSGLLPIGSGAAQQQQLYMQQHAAQQAQQPALLQVQQQYGGMQMPGQQMQGLPGMGQQPGGVLPVLGSLGLGGGGPPESAPLPSFNPADPDGAFNLLGGAFADLDGPMPVGAAAGDARKQQILKQQRWLLFLRHCARCQLSEGQCQYGRNCTAAKQLWQHLVNCKEPNCEFPRCNPSRELLRHHQKCSSANCPVCAPVKQYVSKQRQLVFHRKTANLSPEMRQNLLVHLQQNPRAREVFQAKHGVDAHTIFATLNPGDPAAVAAAAAAVQAGAPGMAAPAAQPALPSMAAALAAGGGGGMPPGMAQQVVLPAVGMPGQMPGGMPAYGGGMVQQQGMPGYAVEALAAPKRQRTHLQENMGTSLIEYFNEQQIQTHVAKSNAEMKQYARGVPKQQAPALDPFGLQEAESSCRVCDKARLTFEPPSLYCFGCGQRIKRNQVFYGTPATHEIKGVWCHPCYGEIKTDTVPLDGFNIRKTDLEKRKNDDEVEEGWVQCDQCEGWVHQICGLFNKGRNDSNRGFLCPFCLNDGLRTGERRIPTERPQAMLTARDLPTCDLSDHLEKRLEQVLRQERLQRAAQEGRHPSDVRTAEGLTVRVVNNVLKRNDVRSRLHAAVRAEGHATYPEAFMYRQKVILLFQNIDGVDLCLYCLYMQEYGADVPPPNRKSVYLSYLDSVKYFQPEDVVAAGRGYALRTLVYHEMLLGYLEYAKARGFESMFIWACPPLAGDDYILYCHPFRQKTPRSDRLREWYITMLKQAQAEGTVTYVSNMWDTYFEGGRDHRLDHLSITQLPYYDGDYWPGEAENLLASIASEAAGGGKGASSKGSKPGGAGSRTTKASLKSKARAGPASGSPTEEVLRRLGDAIQGMREDFIVVHFQEPCSFCREYMSGGMRYYHPNPPQKVVIRSERTFDGISLDKPGSDSSRTVTYTRFALCSRCYSAEIAGHGRGLPPGMALHELLPAPNAQIPPCVDTIPEMENEFFDTRTAFLSLCQGNHYQFDSLRRAKHSSMMVLYHLHNPTAPAFSCTCNVCNKEITGGEGWRCGTCADFDMCNTCFLNPACPRHEHPLVRHARDIDERRNRLTQDQLAARNQALHRTMQVLLHASECVDNKCPSTSCHRVKAMYHHAMNCPTKLSGNCQYCRRMWMLLQMHATQCTVPHCQVPRCIQLRTIRRRQATRQEDKRRAAYRNMLQQQMGR